MKFNSSFAIAAQRSLGITVLVLGLIVSGCVNAGQQTNNNPGAESASDTIAQTDTAEQHDATSQGGQVIEAGLYHLELVTINEPNGTHLDFYLQQEDTHAAIPDANVTAQIQLPDGSEESFAMDYDAQGEHYVALLPVTTPGEYKIAILSDIAGEKVNGRFSFVK